MGEQKCTLHVNISPYWSTFIFRYAVYAQTQIELDLNRCNSLPLSPSVCATPPSSPPQRTQSLVSLPEPAQCPGSGKVATGCWGNPGLAQHCLRPLLHDHSTPVVIDKSVKSMFKKCAVCNSVHEIPLASMIVGVNLFCSV